MDTISVHDTLTTTGQDRKRWAGLTRALAAAADRIRNAFDGLPRQLDGVTIVGVLGAL